MRQLQAKCWVATGALVAIGLFVFAQNGFAGENDKANGAAKSSSDPSSSPDEDDVQHHAALGVSLEETTKGVRVVAVLPASPAARAGLRVGDEIRFVGEQRVRTAQDLIEEIGDYHPGSRVELSIRRNGERQTLTAKLASQSSTFGKRSPSQPIGNDRRMGARGPSGGQDSQLSLAQQVRLLQRQVDRLEQFIYQQQIPGSAPAARDIYGAQPMSGQQRTYPGQTREWSGARQWNSLQRHGEASDDPALFQ